MSAMAFPPWAVWLMLLGLAAFAGMIALSIRRNRGIRRTLFAFPYGLWIVVFTLIPLLLCLRIANRAIVRRLNAQQETS